MRGSLLAMFREARGRLGDPVEAWREIVDHPEKLATYRRQRGKGGLCAPPGTIEARYRGRKVVVVSPDWQRSA